MKKNRLEKIIEIITDYEIETQEELMELLRQEGYTVTQATVSRDLKDLKMSKSMSAQGKYRYEISAERPSVEVSPMESLPWDIDWISLVSLPPPSRKGVWVGRDWHCRSMEAKMGRKRSATCSGFRLPT